MAQTTVVLKKWGNSQGLRIPREACSVLGIDVGSRAEVTVDAENSTMTLRFERAQAGHRYSRHRRMTLEEVVARRAGAWDGTRAGGEEIGGCVGAEEVE